jgi:DNA-binding NtrC family response regulator
VYASTDVLIFGHDAVLLESRQRVLEMAGFRVSATIEREDAKQIASTRKIDVLLLCQTLSQDECDEILIAARRHQPGMKHLYLATQSRFQPHRVDTNRGDADCKDPDSEDEGANFFLSPATLVALVQGAARN